jgi:hypothetical protein
MVIKRQIEPSLALFGVLLGHSEGTCEKRQSRDILKRERFKERQDTGIL